jgi:hypothetical protein
VRWGFGDENLTKQTKVKLEFNCHNVSTRYNQSNECRYFCVYCFCFFASLSAATNSFALFFRAARSLSLTCSSRCVSRAVCACAT